MTLTCGGDPIYESSGKTDEEGTFVFKDVVPDIGTTKCSLTTEMDG